MSTILRNLLSQALVAANNRDKDEAIANITQALALMQAEAAPADDETPGESEPKETLPDRIEDQLTAIYDVQALVSVTIDSIDPDKDFARHRVLRDVYGRLEDIAHEVDMIGTDVRRAVSVISDALLVSP